MEWLGKRLRIRTLPDWHRVKGDDFLRNHGYFLLVKCFGRSVFRAVSETFQERQWNEWQFDAVPKGFWRNPQNRLRYMQWLEKQLGIETLSDWYRISKEDFLRHGGSGMMSLFRCPSRAVKATFPDHEWVPWFFVEIPHGYFADPTNRRLYMDWLGKRLGFQKPEDWYAVTHRTFEENAGQYILQHYYGQSPVAALREYYPDYDWKPWFFAFPGSKFWKKPENRRQYLDWLGRELGFATPEDWKNLRHDHLLNNHGTTLLKFYRRSLAIAMREYLPGHEWEEWLFPYSGGKFWKKRENRLRYLRWLGNTLGFQKTEDWYGLTSAMVCKNRGSQLLTQYYRGSVARMLRDLMPKHDWLEWKFRNIPHGFFDDAVNRSRFLRWLAKDLKLRRPEKWYAVSVTEIRAQGGGMLLEKTGGLCAALKEWQPEHDWKEWLFLSKNQTFWEDATVRRRYLVWLGELLGFRCTDDWLRIRYVDFWGRRGEGLLRQHGGSVARAVVENLPELGLNENDFEWTRIKQKRRKRRQEKG